MPLVVWGFPAFHAELSFGFVQCVKVMYGDLPFAYRPSSSRTTPAVVC